jgi:hypothetical protein
MSGNGKAPLQFPSQAVPIVGQPFTLEAISVPCNAKLRCNCGGTDVQIMIANSVAVACPSCHRVFNVAFNPTKNAVEFHIAAPEPPKVAS